MNKSTIRNITFAILGSFLFGLGIDLNIYCIGTTGFILMFISMCLTIVNSKSK